MVLGVEYYTSGQRIGKYWCNQRKSHAGLNFIGLIQRIFIGTNVLYIFIYVCFPICMYLFVCVYVSLYTRTRVCPRPVSLLLEKFLPFRGYWISVCLNGTG